MSELGGCPKCGRPVHAKIIGGPGALGGFEYGLDVECDCGISYSTGCKFETHEEAIELGIIDWNTRAERTCNYFPDEYQTAFDEKDEEIETGEAFCDGCDYSCDNCGFTMLGGDEGGWFKETPGEYGGWNYEPRFNYCPHCGAKIEMGES